MSLPERGRVADWAEVVVVWLFAVAFLVVFAMWLDYSLTLDRLVDVPDGLVGLLALVPIGTALGRFAKAYYRKVSGGQAGTSM